MTDSGIRDVSSQDNASCTPVQQAVDARIIEQRQAEATKSQPGPYGWSVPQVQETLYHDDLMIPGLHGNRTITDAICPSVERVS